MYFMNAAKSHVIPRFDESDTRKPLIQGLVEWSKVLDHHIQITVLLFYFIYQISSFKEEHIYSGSYLPSNHLQDIFGPNNHIHGAVYKNIQHLYPSISICMHQHIHQYILAISNNTRQIIPFKQSQSCANILNGLLTSFM